MKTKQEKLTEFLTNLPQTRMVITLKNGLKAIVYVKPMAIGNDGIGQYEFWGAKQYDNGHDYFEEYEITKIYSKQKFKDPDEIYMFISDEETSRIIDYLTFKYL